MRRRPRILVVDDSGADFRLLQEAFREHDVEAQLVGVRDGDRALDHLRSSADRPDLILLDLNLPSRGGREVLRALKRDPELLSIPVVVLSTSAAPADVDDCYSLHANAYLVKPLHLDEFGEVVRAIDQFWLRAARLPEWSRA